MQSPLPICNVNVLVVERAFIRNEGGTYLARRDFLVMGRSSSEPDCMSSDSGRERRAGVEVGLEEGGGMGAEGAEGVGVDEDIGDKGEEGDASTERGRENEF